MLGHELAIEQAEAPLDQPGGQMNQRHFGSVALAAEHALAKERRADRYAVEAADEFSGDSAFDAVGVAAAVKLTVKRQDRIVDPALGMTGPRFGAGPHDVEKSRIRADLEVPAAHGAGEALGQMEGIEREDGAQPGIEPVELG